MIELFRRFFCTPLLAVEILVATFFIALMTLAMPLYVIQILNRYVSYGFHGTLITLTSGMLIAIAIQFGFRIIRTKMASLVNQDPNEKLSLDTLSTISRAKAEPFEQFSKTRAQEALNKVQIIQNVYTAQTLNTVMDAPFSLLFIAGTYLLNPVLAWVAVIGILAGLIAGWLGIRKSKQHSDQLLVESAKHRSLNFSAVNSLDTVRAFSAVAFLHNLWKEQISNISILQKK